MVTAILQKLCIYIVTWNVSTKSPDNISLSNLLGLGNNPDADQHHPDLYAIGLQEVNSDPQAQVLGLFKDDPWTYKLKQLLKDRDYVAVKTEQMQGILLILFAKRKHLLHMRDIEAEFTRTGFGGLWGNKGGVSIRLTLYGCGVAFVNSHLAAHDHELDERVNDYKQILDNHHYHVKRYREIYDHDYVFWFGDLNFRLHYEDNTTPEQVRSMIEHDRLKELLQKDQLNLVRDTGKAFYQLQEREPSFPPTFKFEQGTSNYNLKRRPAWTDRILWRVQNDSYTTVLLEVEQKSYKSHPGYNISDHKPVTSEFNIKVFESPVEYTIEFANIPIWQVGDENKIVYTVPEGFTEESGDWIGIYLENFASLSEYIAYEYTNQAGTKKTVENHPNRKEIRIEFGENIDLDEGRTYVLVYFSNTGIRGVSSIAGISNAFRAEKRPASPRFEQVD
ncbi:inositol polyphosphate 5-phosphatase K isoform X2 [Condylostylus longicornis]|uniref:inositol polyphosphate 5-phosphatase K isoform X2 n=1 Tax=Condylostylus longicornis TaxID=2530218 RepID=UPI00244DB40A|nr:inositol polyphosphate 5-phosphatase K isoform X2 [Condylostylus longicornis]